MSYFYRSILPLQEHLNVQPPELLPVSEQISQSIASTNGARFHFQQWFPNSTLILDTLIQLLMLLLYQFGAIFFIHFVWFTLHVWIFNFAVILTLRSISNQFCGTISVSSTHTYNYWFELFKPIFVCSIWIWALFLTLPFFEQPPKETLH